MASNQTKDYIMKAFQLTSQQDGKLKVINKVAACASDVEIPTGFDIREITDTSLGRNMTGNMTVEDVRREDAEYHADAMSEQSAGVTWNGEKISL